MDTKIPNLKLFKMNLQKTNLTDFKKITPIALIILSFFLIHSCNGDKKDEGNEKTIKSDIEEVKELRIAYLPITECSQLYVAQEKGIFDRYNLKVSFIIAKGGQNAIDRLIGKEVEIAFASFATLLANSSKENKNSDRIFSVFGATYEASNNQNHAIFVRKDKFNQKEGIRCLEKLKIAINESQRMEHAILNEYVKIKGLNVGVIKNNLLFFSFSKMYDVIKNGTVDVACMVEPQITLAKNDSNLLYLDDHYLAVNGSISMPVATYISRGSICSEQPDLLRRFTNAMNEATEFMKLHENEVKPIISKYTQIPPQIMVNMGFPEFRSDCEKNDLDILISRINSNGFFEDGKIDSLHTILNRCSK